MNDVELYRFEPSTDLKIERTLDAPVELIWKAWTTPEYLKQWYCPAPWGISKAELDLRPGGAFRITMRSPEGQEFPNEGCFLELVPNRRLVWTDALAPGFRPNSKGFLPKMFLTVVVRMEPEGNGARYSAMALHQDAESRQKHLDMGFNEGWGAVLDQLAVLVKKM